MLLLFFDCVIIRGTQKRTLSRKFLLVAGIRPVTPRCLSRHFVSAGSPAIHLFVVYACQFCIHGFTHLSVGFGSLNAECSFPSCARRARALQFAGIGTGLCAENCGTMVLPVLSTRRKRGTERDSSGLVRKLRRLLIAWSLPLEAGPFNLAANGAREKVVSRELMV